jgi:hypothetical protein
LLKYEAFRQNPDKSFLVLVALDLLSGLTDLGMELQPPINTSSPNLLVPLMVCLKHLQAPVPQSAYTLVDDMALGCSVLLRLHIPGNGRTDAEYDFINPSNNAAWSVGGLR